MFRFLLRLESAFERTLALRVPVAVVLVKTGPVGFICLSISIVTDELLGVVMVSQCPNACSSMKTIVPNQSLKRVFVFCFVFS